MDFTLFDGPLAQRGIGIIAPYDLALERELWRWVPAEVSLHLTRTPYEPGQMNMDMAHNLGNPKHMATATRDLLHVEPEVVAYLCSSASFVNGIDGERELRTIMRGVGAPDAVTTSGALTEVLDEMNLSKISVVTPYYADVTAKLHEFLGQAGVETVASEHLGLGGGIWRVNYRTVAEHMMRVDRPDAEAIFVSCTNLPTYDVIEPLEDLLGKPVFTANQLTMWACLRRMRLPVVGPGKWLAELAYPVEGTAQAI
jgi:maleate isomerase